MEQYAITGILFSIIARTSMGSLAQYRVTALGRNLCKSSLINSLEKQSQLIGSDSWPSSRRPVLPVLLELSFTLASPSMSILMLVGTFTKSSDLTHIRKNIQFRRSWMELVLSVPHDVGELPPRHHKAGLHSIEIHHLEVLPTNIIITDINFNWLKTQGQKKVNFQWFCHKTFILILLKTPRGPTTSLKGTLSPSTFCSLLAYTWRRIFLWFHCPWSMRWSGSTAPLCWSRRRGTWRKHGW